ncbi:cupin domain-containing protein [Kitasatospora sp. RB6PN24]|uniref:JmjC domain-containing protein n=1 Tax=Kitasatospora humi TaxID=2893891 RepID=UPI001E2C1F01|nr:cupin domain-containing protein [Kitasatospora humi]MCC9307657.1 cupin domain-containing protein [Kitasatospora humi]
MSVLTQLVDNPREFLTGWPTEPTVYERDADELAQLFSRNDARRIIADPILRSIELGHVRDGALVADAPDADHPTATLVLNGLHLTWPPLRDASRQLAAELGHPVTANVYSTPPHASGYGPHWDTHHVLLAQVEGAKTWRLHPPIVADPLDIVHRWTKVGFTPEQLKQVRADADTITLTAGQVLYIPRGWVHFGHTTERHALHITFGVQLLTRHWVLRQLLDQATEHPALRAALPPGLSSRPAENVARDSLTTLADWLDLLDPAVVGRRLQSDQQLAVLGVTR